MPGSKIVELWKLKHWILIPIKLTSTLIEIHEKKKTGVGVLKSITLLRIFDVREEAVNMLS